MYSTSNTDKLIVINIAQAMIDYTSIQPDINDTKIQAALLMAQNLDLKKLIGQANIIRCYESTLGAASDADKALRELLLAPLAYFTFSRMLKMFPGTLTDGGYHVDKEGSDKNVTTQTANEYYAVGTEFMDDVFDFLKAESPTDQNVKPENVTPSIRVFGGEEWRGRSSLNSINNNDTFDRR